MADTLTVLQPTLKLPTRLSDEKGVDLGPAQAFKLFVGIPANDNIGATIDNVMVGDQVIVSSASGVCSFKSTNMQAVKAVIGLASAVTGEVVAQVVSLATDVESEGLAGPAGAKAAASFTDIWNKSLAQLGAAYPASAVKNARRDAFGQDPGTGDYAKEEGGLVVCMPECRGAIYATSGNCFQDGAKKNGRKVEYYGNGAKQKNVFFPCPVSGGRMRATAGQPGMVNILAFDSNHNDNAGYYVVSIVVIRGDRPAGASPDELLAKLAGAGPNVQ